MEKEIFHSDGVRETRRTAPRLKINGDYHPLLAHEAAQGDGKKAHAAPDVENGHARTYVCAENPPGVMHPAAERIVDKKAKAPGTDMGGQWGAPLIGT